MKKQYFEKEEQCQRLEVEANILKGILEEKDKQLKFQDSIKILNNILSSQRSPAIKFGLRFHESIKGESSSQTCARNYEINKENSEIFDKDLRSQPNQQPKHGIFQRNSIAPNYRSINQFYPLDNGIECFICHSFGYFVANYRSKFTGISLAPMYSGFFMGYCFSCNMFGYKAIN